MDPHLIDRDPLHSSLNAEDRTLGANPCHWIESKGPYQQLQHYWYTEIATIFFQNSKNYTVATVATISYSKHCIGLILSHIVPFCSNIGIVIETGLVIELVRAPAH